MIKNNRLRLKLKKSAFMQAEVEYLGFKINNQGMSPLREKIESIQSRSKPKNILGLKSLFDLINYFHTNFKNFASLLSHYTNSYVKMCNGNGEWTKIMRLGKPKKC